MKLIVCIFVFILTSGYAQLPSQELALENQRFIDIIGGLSSLTNQLVESVKQALRDLVNQTANWIQNEIYTIDKAIQDGINAFNQYVENVLTIVNQQIKPCLAGAKEKVESIKEETKQSISTCHQQGLFKLMSIQDDIENYREINNSAIGNAFVFIQSCLNQPNFGEKIKCAVDASRNVSKTVEVLRENISETSHKIAAKIRGAVAETQKCVATAIRNGHQSIEDILDEVRECFTSTESSSGETSTQRSSEEGSGSDHQEFVFLW